jgi:ABC-type phosphate transport system substrate-binding protein
VGQQTRLKVKALALISAAGCFLVLAPREAARVAGEGTLRGDGSTPVYPLMRKWISEYKKVSGGYRRLRTPTVPEKASAT